MLGWKAGTPCRHCGQASTRELENHLWKIYSSTVYFAGIEPRENV